MLVRSSEIALPDHERDEPLKAYASSGSNHSLLDQVGAQFDDTIGPLWGHDVNIHFPTAGTWSSYQFLDWIVRKIGPCEMFLTSWTISEKAVKTILKLSGEGFCQSIKILLDGRVRTMCPQAYQMAKANFPEIKLMKIHAKLIVLRNEDWHVSVSSSANLGRNPSVEKYVICTDKKVVEGDTEWISAELENARPFYGNEHETE